MNYSIHHSGWSQLHRHQHRKRFSWPLKLLKADDDVKILKYGANNINIIDNDNSAVESDADNDYFWD